MSQVGRLIPRTHGSAEEDREPDLAAGPFSRLTQFAADVGWPAPD